ncbi:chromosome segregation protein ParM [Pantoea dispersa]|nr:chromosome segregation protein ParM [Pantoea dispersa]
MNKEAAMRISELQRKVLLVLSELEARGHDSPLPVMQLLKLLNSASCKDIYDTNLRTSLHTLHRNGLVQKYRNASLHLAFSLTETGRRRAAAIRYELVL